jgi:hypothetical protein
MAGFSVGANQHLIRSNVWTQQLKEILLEDLMGTRYIDMITDFPDGNTWNMPSIGLMDAQNYAEGQAVRYTSMDTGNFTFTIDKYKYVATSITEQMKQDSFYTSQLVASFVPRMRRALMKSLEIDILAAGPNGQTASNLNVINGANHRWVGSGSNQTIDVRDFALARNALQMANVGDQSLVAIVHPSVEFALNTMTNLVNVSNNPRWEGIVAEGIASGMRFVKNIYGFDVYTTMNVKNIGAETINGRTTSVGVGNLFFSAAPDVLPIKGLIKQSPKVDSEYNKDLQQEEYVTTMRYGLKLFRPENMVVVITDTNQVL